MSARLEQYLIKNKLSLSVFVQGVWVALLEKYLQQEQILYGMITTGRTVPISGIEHMAGHSINIVPVLVPLTAWTKEKQFTDFLKNILEIQVEWSRYEHTPIDKINEWLDWPADQPLLDHFIVVQNLGSARGEIRGMERDGTYWPRDAEFMFAKMEYPMRFDVFPGYEYCFTFRYYLRYFTLPAVKGLMDNLKILVETIIENPHQNIAEWTRVIDIDRYQLHENDIPDGFVPE